MVILARKLGEEEIKDVLVGATFMGSGGGGSGEQGLELLESLKKELGEVEIELISPEEMDPNGYAVMVAGIGAPKALKERGFGPEAKYAFETFQKVFSLSGREVNYLMAGELGGFNTMVPMYVSALEGVPFVDGDGNGRAVPELSTGLYPAYEIPPNPLVLANSKGTSVVAYLSDPLDHVEAEKVARGICVAWDMVAAFCTWPVNRDQILNCLAPHSVSRCEKVGKAFREVKESGGGIEELSKKLSELGSKEIFVGKISKIEVKTEGGFDFGVTYIEGLGKYEGSEMAIFFKNENIFAKVNGKLEAVVPDLISIVDVDTLSPTTNADTKEGEKVAVYLTEAPENWKKNPKGKECWKHILEAMGLKEVY